jgi:polyisoprenoid-binding protein YceI
MPSTTDAAIRYSIDTRASQFTVQAFASGLISALAHSPKIAIRDWTGDIRTPNDLIGLSMTVRIKAASLDLLDEVRDSDRRELHRVMNDEVLETATYPEILFQSLQSHSDKLREDLYRLTVQGKLTLHGITNDHSFVTQVAFGVDTARAHGEFKIRQTDYDIRIASIAGGTLKLQDELKCSLYVVARRQL